MIQRCRVGRDACLHSLGKMREVEGGSGGEIQFCLPSAYEGGRGGLVECDVRRLQSQPPFPFGE